MRDVKIETERLVIRELRDDDWSALHEVESRCAGSLTEDRSCRALLVDPASSSRRPAPPAPPAPPWATAACVLSRQALARDACPSSCSAGARGSDACRRRA